MEYNILCFHGYNQSCEMMKSRMNKIEKEFKGISFDYAESNDINMWYSINIDNINPLKVLTDEIPSESYHMIEENMKHIDKILETKKYDGFIGFSQGSVFARWYISTRKPQIKFFISIGSFDANHKLYNIHKLKFPKEIQLYNLYGKDDLYVPSTYSKILTHFIGGTNVEFIGKHIIPIKETNDILNKIYN